MVSNFFNVTAHNLLDLGPGTGAWTWDTSLDPSNTSHSTAHTVCIYWPHLPTALFQGVNLSQLNPLLIPANALDSCQLLRLPVTQPAPASSFHPTLNNSALQGSDSAAFPDCPAINNHLSLNSPKLLHLLQYLFFRKRGTLAPPARPQLYWESQLFSLP